MRILFTFLFFSIQVLLFSQTVPSDRITVYDSYQPAKGKNAVLKNCISLNPLAALVGDFPLYYDRLITDRFSVQIGIGVTSTNYMFDMTGPAATTSSNYDDNLDRKYNLGYSFMIQPKIYLNDSDFEGTYLGLEFRNRHYSMYADTYGTQPIGERVEEYRIVKDAKFNVGYSGNIGSNVIFDAYFGFGLRFLETKFAQADPYQTGPSGNYFDVTYQTDKNSLPTLAMGFRIGYAF